MEKTSNMKRIITCVRVIYYFALLFTLFEKGMSDKALRYIQCYVSLGRIDDFSIFLSFWNDTLCLKIKHAISRSTAGETVKEIYSFICDEKNPYIVLDCISLKESFEERMEYFTNC
ncbi:unnamed protein product [Larinioides sclopetarius]|uniref:Uncharacterized protein n=1 Tax=Larinioides sclopetarius TaxID=280406 RepID=A0AAV2B6E1_9ARAC